MQELLPIIAVMALLIGVLVAFIREWAPPEVIAMSAFCLLVLGGILTPDKAFEVFSNQAPITIAAMFIMSGALEKSGVIDQLGNLLNKIVGNSTWLAIPPIMIIVAICSAFINNSLMPVFFGNAVGSTSSILYHYTAPVNPINDWLTAETVARYQVPPDLFDADGMNAAIMAVEAFKATGGDTSSAALIGAMEGMSFEGPKGTIYVRPEDHVAIQDMYVLKLVNVDDPDFKFYETVATVRPEPPCLLPEALKDRCGDLPYGSLSGE